MTATIDVSLICSRFDLRDLASAHTTLHRHSGQELAGPCPRCGGEDRFFVGSDYFGCRQCHPKRGDAIDFTQWLYDLDFISAIKRLGDTPAPAKKKPEQQIATHKKEIWRVDNPWTARHTPRIAPMRAALDNPDCPGYDYLVCRGFAPETWQVFHAGYEAGRDAISLPWYRSGVLAAIRYRLVAPVGEQEKVISERGSTFGGGMFGGQALPLPYDSPMVARRYLVICEGELNAMSIWQVANRARVDVLSLGSESALLPDRLGDIAGRYRAVIVWMDKEAIARKHAATLGGMAFWSESNGQKRDANDWLQDGQLGELIGRLLRRATPAQHAEALRWDLWDGGIG